MLQRHDQPDLLLVALAVLAEAPARIEVEHVDEAPDVVAVDPAAQVPEILDRLRAGQTVVQVELSGQVADPSMDRDRVYRRLDTEHLRSAGRRPDEIEQDPHRGRLAGTIRPEEPEDLAFGDLEIEIDDAPVLPICLG